MNRTEAKKAWCLDLGLVPYEEGLKLQERLAFKRSRGIIEDTLILLEHPPVFTANPKKGFKHVLVPHHELAEKGISICETNRGGDVTYHGPGQLVGYLIVDLKEQEGNGRHFIYRIEDLLIRLLKDYHICATRIMKYPGVWVNNQKIAAIGVAIKSDLITMHGFSLNINPNLDHFSMIIPCGIRDKGITSMIEILGDEIDQKELRQRLKRQFEAVFDREIKNISPRELQSVSDFQNRQTPDNYSIDPAQVLCVLDPK